MILDDKALLRAHEMTAFETHPREYIVGGVKMRRVSSVLSVINKPALVGWAKNVTADAFERALRDEDVRGGLRDLVASEGEAGPLYDAWVERLVAWGRRAADVHRDNTAQRGTDLHAAIEHAILGPGEPGGIGLQADNFLSDRGMGIVATEYVVWDHNRCIAGTVDAVARDDDGALYVVDWKTGKGVYPEMALQVAAYAGMLAQMVDEVVAGAYVVRLSEDSYEAHAVALPAAQKAWNAALKLQNNMKGDLWQ